MSHIKAKVKWLTRLRLQATCPQCRKVHIFSVISFDRMILDNDESDDFTINQESEHVRTLYPRFICRNVKCNHDSVIRFLTYDFDMRTGESDGN